MHRVISSYITPNVLYSETQCVPYRRNTENHVFSIPMQGSFLGRSSAGSQSASKPPVSFCASKEPSGFRNSYPSVLPEFSGIFFSSSRKNGLRSILYRHCDRILTPYALVNVNTVVRVSFLWELEGELVHDHEAVWRQLVAKIKA